MLRQASFALVATSLLSASPAGAEQWYFYVQNKSSSRITQLETKEKGGSWGSFELDGGIRSGETSKLIWDASTNTQDCKQYIRASFADGSTSEPVLFDFCKDLDDPIVFED
ncbi:MAG: hypothetical protein RLZZ631_986 [Cyanobacteriota bacterium]|jgi:hypothetical protein